MNRTQEILTIGSLTPIVKDHRDRNLANSSTNAEQQAVLVTEQRDRSGTELLNIAILFHKCE